MARTFTARWLFPADRPPLAHGTITIQGEKILAVEPHGRRQPDEDLGDVAILPGLVNAHTHLDLSGMRGLCPPSPDFPAWLRNVVKHRRQTAPEQVQDDIRTGLAECLRHGTTLIGDISSQGQSWPILSLAPLRSVVFLELLGLTVSRSLQAMQQAEAWLLMHRPLPHCRPALSPHAPYSVRTALFARIADMVAPHDDSADRDLGPNPPVAIHLAESVQELELLEHRRGPMIDFLTDLGVCDLDGLAKSPAEVARMFQRVPRTLLIHANYLAAADVGPAAVVYCPRTHAAFGHPPHPFREFLANGICVALGTDSLASNPDLDILAEARFLHQRHPDVPGDILLRLVTVNGAIALGRDDAAGSLTCGKSADLVVLPIEPLDVADPHQLIFASDHRVKQVMYRGELHTMTP